MKTFYLDRFYYSPAGTAGTLTVDGIDYHTVERPWLNNEPFKSCIPDGTYTVKPYNSEKFPNVWEIQCVQGRSHILIHAGNKPSDVQGCIAIGRSRRSSTPLWVGQSRAAIRELRASLPDEFRLVIRPFSTHNRLAA